MVIKENLKNGEFPSCEKCLLSGQISPYCSTKRECHLTPDRDSTLRTSFCSQGTWHDFRCSDGYLSIIDFEDAYADWYFFETKRQAEQKEADRITELLHWDFSYLELQG